MSHTSHWPLLSRQQLRELYAFSLSLAVTGQSPPLALLGMHSHLRLPLSQILCTRSYHLSFPLLRVTVQILGTDALSLT